MNRLRIQQRLVTCNLSLVTGDLHSSGPSVTQSPVTSYQLPVTSLMGVSLRGSWSQGVLILGVFDTRDFPYTKPQKRDCLGLCGQAGSPPARHERGFWAGPAE